MRAMSCYLTFCRAQESILQLTPKCWIWWWNSRMSWWEVASVAAEHWSLQHGSQEWLERSFSGSLPTYNLIAFLIWTLFIATSVALTRGRLSSILKTSWQLLVRDMMAMMNENHFIQTQVLSMSHQSCPQVQGQFCWIKLFCT